MLRTLAAASILAVFGVTAFGAVASQAAPFCKTLKGAGVAVGEASSRKDADEALDKAIAEWAEHYQVSAQPKNRTMACKVYIEFLNEFECNAEAVLCRDIPGAKTPEKTAAQAPAAKKAPKPQ